MAVYEHESLKFKENKERGQGKMELFMALRKLSVINIKSKTYSQNESLSDL